MRKIVLILFAAIAVTLTACSKEKRENPSIADTSAKQMQPGDEQSITGDLQGTPDEQQQSDQSTNNMDDQSTAQNGMQDQSGVNQAQPPEGAPVEPTPGQPDLNQGASSQPPSASAPMNPPTEPAQLDESKDNQAQVPELPQDSDTTHNESDQQSN